MDVALHKAGVTFVLDRAGVTGPDGPSHHGIWDLAILQVVPNIRLAAPRDGARFREELAEAVARRRRARPCCDSPRAASAPTSRRCGAPTTASMCCARHEHKDVLIVDGRADGRTGAQGRRAARGAGHRRHGRRPALGGARAASILALAADHRIVVTIEDGIRVGGIGTRVRQDLREAGIDTAVDELGLPDEFIDHATREQILEEAGLTPQKIARDLVAQVLGSRIPIARPLPADELSERHLDA